MKLEEAEIKKRVYEAVELLDIDPAWMKKSPFELSGGQKRRVAMAGVLAMQPEVLVLDEPAAGLDPRGREEVLNLVADLHKQRNISVVLVSHSMEDIAKMATEVVVMNEGTIAMQGSVSDVFSKGEQLAAMGLDVPQITVLSQRLRKLGYQLPTDIYTVERAHDEILKLFHRED